MLFIQTSQLLRGVGTEVKNAALSESEDPQSGDPQSDVPAAAVGDSVERKNVKDAEEVTEQQQQLNGWYFLCFR